MRKTAAIFLLTLFLFNLIGYKCWYYYLQQKENRSFEARLDNSDYNEKDLIAFKVPLSNSYQSGWREIERVDGEINIQGVIYKYVLRKVEDGQLIVYCLPHYNKMRLAKADSEFGQHGNDLAPTGKQGKANNTARSALPDEFEQLAELRTTSISERSITAWTRFIDQALPACHLPYSAQPPDLV